MGEKLRVVYRRDREDAEQHRLRQAEDLMREAGFAPDDQGRWHPVGPADDGPDARQ